MPNGFLSPPLQFQGTCPHLSYGTLDFAVSVSFGSAPSLGPDTLKRQGMDIIPPLHPATWPPQHIVGILWETVDRRAGDPETENSRRLFHPWVIRRDPSLEAALENQTRQNRSDGGCGGIWRARPRAHLSGPCLDFHGAGRGGIELSLRFTVSLFSTLHAT